MNVFTSSDETRLRETLKGCSAATYEAVRAFRKTGNVGNLPVIVHGVIERYVSRDLRSRLERPDGDLLLSEHLGIDSLTMMEIIILAEDVLQISINNADLRHLRTVGDVQQFMAAKLPGITSAGW